MKKIISLFLVCMLFCGVLISCGENNPKENETTYLQEENSPYLDALPETMDFGNKEIKFLVTDDQLYTGVDLGYRSVGLNDYVLGNNAVDDAVYKRNLKTEERLKVVLSSKSCGEPFFSHNPTVYTDLLTGQAEYDIISPYGYDTSLANKGLILNFKELDDYHADYLNLKADYWSQSGIEAASYQGLLYWITGELSLRYSGGVYCTFVNTELYGDALEGTYGSIYQIVRDKQWTLDKIYEMCVSVYDDCGTKEGSVDMDDRLAFCVGVDDPVAGFFSGCDIPIMVKDPGGNPMNNVTTENERIYTFFDKTYKLLVESGTSYIATGSVQSLNIFQKGKTCFIVDKLYQAEYFLSEIEYYGIIPCPMLSTDQKNYVSPVQGANNVYGIYVNCGNIPAAAAVLEAFCAMSLQEVSPVYFDMALKYRYTRDEDSADMVELIRSTRAMDFSTIMGGAIYDQCGVVITSDFLNKAISQKSFTSLLKTFADAWELGTDAVLEIFDNYIETGVYPQS